MDALIPPGTSAELLYTGAAWTEGPAWLPRTGRLRFSDIPNNRILDWDQASGETTVAHAEAEFANGRTLDQQGRIVQCSHGRRAIEREGADGGTEILVDRWEGGRFNSPNDVAVAADGSIWFTDPPYGLHPSGREGRPGPQDYEGCYVFRFDPGTGVASPVVTSMTHPNGIAFSPDGGTLYVSDTGFYGPHPEAKHILAFDVDGGHAAAGRVFATVPHGASDGFAIDREGRLWSSAGDGVYVYAPDGGLLGHVPIPETVSNVCFGGDDGSDLFITASSSLYRLRTLTTAPHPPTGL